MKQLSIYTSPKETVWGIRYLLFELLFLPLLLNLANAYLRLGLSATWLNMVFYAINLLAVLIIFRDYLKRIWKHAFSNIGKVLGTAALGFIIYWCSMTVLSMVILYLIPDFSNINDANLSEMIAEQFLPMAIATVVAVPLTEELLFRGALFSGFHRRNPRLAWVLSVIAFCLVHVMGYADFYPWKTLLVCALQYIPAGICLAWAYQKSGNIAAPMLMHAAINVIGVLAMR